jgi:hypothetical protein
MNRHLLTVARPVRRPQRRLFELRWFINVLQPHGV